MHDTRPAHHIVLHFITLVLFVEQYTIWSFLLCSFIQRRRHNFYLRLYAFFCRIRQ